MTSTPVDSVPKKISNLKEDNQEQKLSAVQEEHLGTAVAPREPDSSSKSSSQGSYNSNPLSKRINPTTEKKEKNGKSPPNKI